MNLFTLYNKTLHTSYSAIPQPLPVLNEKNNQTNLISILATV